MSDKYVALRLGAPINEAPRDYAEYASREANYKLSEDLPGPKGRVFCRILRERSVTDQSWDQWRDTFRSDTRFHSYTWSWADETGCPTWEF